MQFSQLCAGLAALLLQLASGTRGDLQDPGVTALGTVTKLLEDLLKKSEEEKHEEEVQRASEKTLCEHSVASLEASISESTRETEALQVGIDAANAKLAELRDLVARDNTDIEAWQGEKTSATTLRENEHSEYSDAHRSYTESIDALRAAIATLKKQDHSRDQSLVQSDAQQRNSQNQTGFRAQLAVLQTMAHIPAKAREALALFLQDEDVAVVVGAPAAYGYEFQSGGLIEMLEGLLEKFTDERTTLEKEEVNKRHAHDMLMANLDASIKQATSANDVRAGSITSREGAVSSDTGSLTKATESKTANEGYLVELRESCEEKEKEFAEAQTVRAEEIEVIKQAIELLESSDVKGHAETYLSAAQSEATGHGRKALASLRASLSDDGDNERRAHEFLLEQAGKLNSDLLETLASKIQRDDPLAKVKQMIDALVTRLQEEAANDMDHNDWCVANLATQQTSLDATSSDVVMLTEEVDRLTASIAKGSAKLAETTSEIANIMADIEKEKELHAEKEELSTKTIEDAEAASAAVLNAKEMLTSLFDHSPFPKETSESIIALLTLVHQSFVKVQVTAEATKSSDEADYAKFNQKSEELVNTLDAEKKHLTETKTNEEHSLSSKTEDLDGKKEILTASQATLTAMKANCGNGGISHEERSKRREQEIQSLKEALEILGGESVALL